jgi:exoribonuclease-2
MSSPLRRYVDLVNQWQLVATLQGSRAPYARNSDALLSALRAFELTYARYDEHQRAMETYWSLRWLLQERLTSIEAFVWRENLVRLEGLPLFTRVSSLPALPSGARVRLEITGVDLIDREVSTLYRATLRDADAAVQDRTEGASEKA